MYGSARSWFSSQFLHVVVESPGKKWPDVFSRWSLFITYPYLLPTAIASLVTFAGEHCIITTRRSNNTALGALLSLLLGPDGGPREGGIRLPAEKIPAHETIEEEPDMNTRKTPSSTLTGLGRLLFQKVSRYFTKHEHGVQSNSPPSSDTRPPIPVRLSTPTRGENESRNRTFSRTSQADGSAYGYDGRYRSRVTSNLSQRLAGRRGSLASTIARRRSSYARQNGVDAETGQAVEGELNLAQRLLMANEFAVNNIADLWVAAAINADNEDPFLSDSEPDDNPFHEDEDDEDDGSGRYAQSSNHIGRHSVAQIPGNSSLAGAGRSSSSATHRPSTRSLRPDIHALASHRMSSPARYTGANRRTSSSIPAIFSHTGIRSSPADRPTPGSHQLLPRSSMSNEATRIEIPVEGQSPSRPMESRNDDGLTSMSEKQPSLLAQLPLAIIFQYGLLALHSTTHDQIFLSYLVS